MHKQPYNIKGTLQILYVALIRKYCIYFGDIIFNEVVYHETLSLNSNALKRICPIWQGELVSGCSQTLTIHMTAALPLKSYHSATVLLLL